MFVFTIWIISIVCTLIVAANKGRSKAHWFIISFFLGPLGFLISLIVSKNTEQLDIKAIRSGEKKRCPSCAEVINTAAKRCRYCHAEQNDELSKNDVASIPEDFNLDSLQRRFCRYCHGAIPARIAYCPSCNELNIGKVSLYSDKNRE